MNPITMVLVAALTFGICFLCDKLFIKAFRSKRQHRTGLSVRVSKRYASFGAVLIVLGIAAIFTGMGTGGALLWGGVVVLVIGIGLIVYYNSFAVFYDDDSFLLNTFGKKGQTYAFRDIRFQQLYLIQGGSIVVELHLTDGNALSIHSSMEGAYPFLDHAFAAWCRQTGKKVEDCNFHDPANSLWFPNKEEA